MHATYASASRGLFLFLRKSIMKTKFIINITISIISTTIPVVGLLAIVPGRTTTENQIIAAVTVIHSRYAGINTTFTFFAFCRLVTQAAPVSNAIDAISWFAEPKEGHRMVKLPLHAR